MILPKKQRELELAILHGYTILIDILVVTTHKNLNSIQGLPKLKIFLLSCDKGRLKRYCQISVCFVGIFLHVLTVQSTPCT